MKKQLLLLFSFLFVCNKISFSNTKDSGLIFFTNFKYFKSNERNFRSIQSPIPRTTPGTPTPDKPTSPPSPDIPTPPDLNPEEPEIIPPNPDVPSKPDVPAYSEIFFDNNWILNTHSYTTSKDLEVSHSNSLLTGMGVIAGGASITNSNNILIKNELAGTNLVGMLSLNGGEIINSSNGNISIDGVGKNFGMYIKGDGLGKNFGTINVSDSQIGVVLDGNGAFTNSGNIEVSGNSMGIVAQNFGQVTNKGTITLSPSTAKTSGTNLGAGILISTGGVADNFGTINVLSDQIGMASKDSGSLFNSGEINLTNQGFGMAAINSTSGSLISNDDKGVIKGDAQAGIFVHGLGSTQNYGNIDISNGLSAMIINGQGSAYNLGTIDLKNTKYGMLSLNGGAIFNGGTGGTPSQITTDNKELAQMAVFGNGAAFNHGSLTTANAPHLMYLSGTGSLTNYGELSIKTSNDSLSYSAMFGEKGGTLTNYKGGTISIDGGGIGFAMGILDSGRLSNNGTINAGDFENGILLTGSATGTNNGDINFSFMGTGVALYNTTEDGFFANFGSIEDNLHGKGGGDFGIYATGRGTIENLGSIKLSMGMAAIHLSGKGEATNYYGGNIKIYRTRFGMYATNGAKITNEGNIDITPLYDTYIYPNGGMFVEGNGTALNSGTITFGGFSTNGMASLGPNANLINGAHGVINILNDASESFAFNTYNRGGVATNKGLVNLGEKGELINGGTLFNYGNIVAPNGIKNGPNGILVMEKGGTVDTPLKEALLGLSYAQKLYSNDTDLTTLNLPFVTESATSYSHLYEIAKDRNDFLMRRKNFTEISERNLGNFLESMYFDSNNTSKDRFFNVLMTSQNNDQYNGYLDSFFGRDIYPNIVFQTRDTIQYATEDILDNLGEKLPQGRESSYIVGYTFEKFRQKGFDRVEGHEDNLNGFYLGKQYYLDSTKDYGFVFSYTRLDSDYYSNSGEREDNFLQGTSFLNYNKDNLSGIGALYLGYSTGDIKRSLDLNYLDYSGDSPKYSNINERYKGDIKNLYLGVSGTLSKQYSFNNFFLEPEVEAYVLGVHQKKINESSGEYELGIDSLNSVFSKIKAEIGLGKTFTPTPEYLLTFKVTGALAQEINSKNNDLDVSLKNISDKKGVIKVDRDNQFSQEIGAKLSVSNSAFNNFNFYVDYKYIFEDDNSWKIGTGINYSF